MLFLASSTARWMALSMQLVLCITFVQAVPTPTPENKTCNPIPESLEQVYVIGYGSLVSSVSKTKTDPNTGINIPVNVSGYARRWNCHGSPIGLGTTFLGVEKSPKHQFNGVVFKLNSLEGLTDFDNREKYYCREEVPFEDIKFLISADKASQAGITLPDASAKFYIYVVKPKFIDWPSRRYPIVQSYVDVFLTGCLEMQKTYGVENYADDCISTTEGWDYPWVDDRHTPRRPWTNQPKASEIDSLINKFVPSHFENVLVEQEIRYSGKNSGATSSFNRFTLGFLAVTLSSIMSAIF